MTQVAHIFDNVFSGNLSSCQLTLKLWALSALEKNFQKTSSKVNGKSAGLGL